MPGKEQNEKNTETFSLPGLHKKTISPLNDPVWRLITIVLGGSLITWFLRILLGAKSGFAIWCVALAALATWVFAIRMLLLETKFKKFWTFVYVPAADGGGSCLCLCLRIYNFSLSAVSPV